MADSWDSEDFDPEVGFQAPAVSDKWEGEDEPEDVKDAWDDEEEQEEGTETKKEEKPAEVKAFQVKKKKTKLDDLSKKKDEQRRQKIEELKAREQDKKELTSEEIAAEKLRQQRLQEEADLEVTKEVFATNEADVPTIDSLNPKSKDDFNKFSKLLKEKLSKLEPSPFYVDFLEDLVKDCCINLETEHVRRIGSSISSIANEKSKAEKAVKSKKKSKKAVLAGGIKGGKRDEFDADLRYDELEDFM